MRNTVSTALRVVIFVQLLTFRVLMVDWLYSENLIIEEEALTACICKAIQTNTDKDRY